MFLAIMIFFNPPFLVMKTASVFQFHFTSAIIKQQIQHLYITSFPIFARKKKLAHFSFIQPTIDILKFRKKY